MNQPSPLATQPNSSAAPAWGSWRLWNAIAALTLGGVATAVTRLFQGGRPPADLTLTSVLVFATTSVCAAGCWYALITRPRRVTPARAALAGTSTAMLGFLLVYQVANLVYGAATPEDFGDSLGSRVVVGVLLSLVTLLFSGWFVVPLLALSAVVLARIQVVGVPALQRHVEPQLRGFVKRSRSMLRGHPALRVLLVLSALVVGTFMVLGAWIWSRPLRIDSLTAIPAPVTDFATARAAIRARIDRETADPTLNSVCASRLLDQGRRAEKVIVLFHGFTNCPAQFEPLAQQLAERGYNVYVPRLPRHGYADRLTGALEQLSADELVRFADGSVDLARGLGDQVTVVGLSGGANVAAWIAQHRSDVAHATLIAPMFHIEGLPAFSIRPAASTVLAVPDFYLWWDGQRRERALGPPYAYPRYPVHAIGALLRLSFAVQDAAGRAPPAVQRILVVSNAADTAISNKASDAIADAWARNGATVRRYVFPAELGLNHDVIDVHQPKQRVDLVYPTLIKLLEAGA